MEVAVRRLYPDRCVVAVAGPYPEADGAAPPDGAAGDEDTSEGEAVAATAPTPGED